MSSLPDAAPDLSALSNLAPELAKTLVSIAGDIALVIDRDGVIRNVAVGAAPLAPSAGDWVGRAWADTVTGETRGKVEKLLQEVSDVGVSRRREVNHASSSGDQIPMSYAAVRLGENGPLLAVGRDLRAIAAIQQRFVESQQELERDYWKMRQAESRYRQLFQVANDAVLVVDALTMLIVEANPAAVQLFGLPHEALVGFNVSIGIDMSSCAAVEAVQATARSTGRPAEIRARLASRPEIISISATPFRTENAVLLLVRARSSEAHLPGAEAAALADFVERTPDAVVITDSAGRVLMANPAFLGLCRMAADASWRGRSLAEWVGKSDGEFDSLIEQVKGHGIATRVTSVVRSVQGAAHAVEISATLLDEGDQEAIGFTLRRLGPVAETGVSAADELVRSIEGLGLQLGESDLSTLMQEASALVERHLLASALRRVGGDRERAAAILEISRLDLDKRMLRHGLDAGSAHGDSATPTFLN